MSVDVNYTLRVVLFVLLGTLSLFESVVTQSADTRQVHTAAVCPGRDTVVATHLYAEGVSDTIHYVLSVRGLPSLLIARTALNASLQVDCDQLYNTSLPHQHLAASYISFTGKLTTVIVLLFTELIEFVDAADVGILTHYNESLWLRHNLSVVAWSNITLPSKNVALLTAYSGPNNSALLGANASLSLRFEIFGNTGFNEVLPSLPFNDNMTHMTLVLDGLATQNEKSRFAAELVLVTRHDIGNDMQLKESRTIDDEHSPGSFHIVDWVTDSASNANAAFLSWRPICYTAPTPSVAVSTQVQRYELRDYEFLSDSMFSSGLAFAFFGHFNATTVNVKSSFVSFGVAGDRKFYNSTHYTTWTVSVGLGSPIQSSLSLLVILVISIGLGVPFLLIIVSALYFLMKRLQARYHSYQLVATEYEQIN